MDDIDCPESSECNNGWAYVFDLSEFCGGCPADFDGDGAVGPADLAILLGSWGPCEGCPADFNGDGEVNAFDLAQLLGDWGLCR